MLQSVFPRYTSQVQYVSVFSPELEAQQSPKRPKKTKEKLANKKDENLRGNSG